MGKLFELLRSAGDPVIGYASRTGTRRNLAALRRAGWRLLVSATGCWRHEGFPYAIDNGAWTAHQQGHDIDLDIFARLLAKMGRDADWVVVPDIVGGGLASLDLTLEWLPRVMDEAPRAMIAVQDGIEVDEVETLLGDRVGVFVGGSTEWKLSTMGAWAEAARRHGAWCHIARVNTARRIRRCHDVGAHSFDGTSASRFSKTLPRLDHARRQPTML